MRQAIIFFVIVLNWSLANAQIKTSLDSVFNTIKNRSVYRHRVNWDDIENKWRAKLSTAKNDLDSINSFISVFESLNDFHSSITYNYKQFSNYPDFDDSTRQKLLPLVYKSMELSGKFSAQKIGNDYLYLLVPGIQAWGDQVNLFAKSLSDTLCQYSSDLTKGVIIDLRLNDGGQLISMISGLALLLGNNYLGSGVDENGLKAIDFSINNQNLSINNSPQTSIVHKCSWHLTEKPVVIIIGPATRSSGSITAILFKGRPNTYFIGEKTAEGYSTGNDYFYFDENLSLNLSTFFNQDRNKKVYKTTVDPDLSIKEKDNFDQIESDPKIKAAIMWLRKHNSR